MKKFRHGLAAAVLFLGRAAVAEPPMETLKPENGMYLLWSMGNLTESRDPRPSKVRVWENEWIYELVGGLVMNSSPVERLRLTVNFEMATYNVYPREPFVFGEPVQDTRFDGYLEEAKGVFTFGQAAPSAFEFEFGYFLNRYNKHARVFGEYLFRSMIYPSILFNNFDYPWTPLSGLRIGQAVTENLRHNLYILSETDHYPYFDISVAYEAGWRLFQMVEIGAGVNLHRAVPVRPSLTTPEQPTNTYVKIPAQSTVYKRDSLGNIVDSIVIATQREGFLNGQGWHPGVDNSLKELPNHRLHPGIRTTEETVYSFQGTVPMARFALFPFGRMSNPILTNMLTVYGETAVLGWKNYPYLYENREERIPVMAGVQFSMPRIVDVLAFEIEHFGSKSIPSYYYRGQNNIPVPGAEDHPSPTDTAAISREQERLTHDDWKWMLYVRKQFPGIALTFQVGTDHMRRTTENYGIRYDEILTRLSQVYWQMRIRIPY